MGKKDMAKNDRKRKERCNYNIYNKRREKNG